MFLFYLFLRECSFFFLCVQDVVPFLTKIPDRSETIGEPEYEETVSIRSGIRH